MLKHIKQARAAFSMLSADEVRKRATTPVHIGLVADSSGAYAEMEGFLGNLDQVHRASDPHPPETVDIVLYEPGLSCPEGAFNYHRHEPNRAIGEILDAKPELALALANQFPVFRIPVIDRLITEVCRENAFFAIATALPNVVPNLIELPWLFGEFASDTVFLTANQVRMAFQIAAACGKDPGLVEQKFEVIGLAGSAFGWRALARELVSHIPLGGGLIPKGAIAYAGTYLAGKGLERIHLHNGKTTAAERRALWDEGMTRGRQIEQTYLPRDAS